MEILDIVDEQGEPVGRTVERERAHREGIRHRTSHVWIYRIRKGRYEILLQKRCREKDSYPGCYDISSAGHIPAGAGYEESAIRELQEELGIFVSEEELILCGSRSITWDAQFHGKPFHDRQVSRVFLLHLENCEEEDFRLQESEIEAVRWMDYEACRDAVIHNRIPHCIVLEELDMLRNCWDRLERDCIG